ncbi:MmyB family transcriptional regulator [Streptomyces cellulosae]
MGSARTRRGPRPNIARMTFLDPATRDLLVDWEAQARDITGTCATRPWR